MCVRAPCLDCHKAVLPKGGRSIFVQQVVVASGRIPGPSWCCGHVGGHLSQYSGEKGCPNDRDVDVVNFKSHGRASWQTARVPSTHLAGCLLQVGKSSIILVDLDGTRRPDHRGLDIRNQMLHLPLRPLGLRFRLRKRPQIAHNVQPGACLEKVMAQRLQNMLYGNDRGWHIFGSCWVTVSECEACSLSVVRMDAECVRISQCYSLIDR